MTTINVFNRRVPEVKPGKIKLNIGCGKSKIDGFLGMDVRDCGQEIVWDMTQGIPFPDGSCEHIFTSHTLEHLTDEEAKDFLRETYRTLKKGGVTFHAVPHALDPSAYFFDHKTFWNENRVLSMIDVPGLEGFEIIKNETNRNGSIMELVFGLRKK